MTNPDPNQPRYPYGGGTDNPSESTAYTNPGGPTGVESTETAPLTTNGLSLTASVPRHPGVLPGISASGTDTPTTHPNDVIGLTPASIGESAVDRGADPEGGVDPLTGAPREAGQDETAGATETTSGSSPAAFPEPTP